MKLRINILSAILFSLGSIMYSCKSDTGEWTNLLDKDLSKWNMYLGYRLKNGYDGSQPVDEKGQLVEPVGYNINESNVFSVGMAGGEPVLHITGEIYGCVFTKEEFSNFEIVSSAFVYYKRCKCWVISKNESEGLFEVVKDEHDGVCDLWKSKWVRFENCIIIP